MEYASRSTRRVRNVLENGLDELYYSEEITSDQRSAGLRFQIDLAGARIGSISGTNMEPSTRRNGDALTHRQASYLDRVARALRHVQEVAGRDAEAAIFRFCTSRNSVPLPVLCSALDALVGLYASWITRENRHRKSEAARIARGLRS